MSRRIRYTAEEKYGIFKAYENGIGSMSESASMYKVNTSTLKEWRDNFEKYGSLFGNPQM